MALVVEHGQNHVVAALCCLVKNSVGGHGPDGVDSLFLRRGHGWGYLLRFLVTQQAAIAPVGIERGHSDFWAVDPPFDKAVVGKLEKLQNPLLFHIVASQS